MCSTNVSIFKFQYLYTTSLYITFTYSIIYLCFPGSSSDMKNCTANSCVIRSFQSDDEANVKRLLRDAAFSNVWPGVRTTINHRWFKALTLLASLIVYACTQSVLYCLAIITVSCLFTYLTHTIAAVYYVYGPPLADLNHISYIYQTNTDTQFWVAEIKSDNGAADIAGTVAIIQKSDQHQPGVAYLRRMAVSNKYRNRGIARQLLESAVIFCRLHRYRRIELITTDIHVAAMHLYRKFGFQCVSYQPRQYFGGLVSIWTYEFEYFIDYDE